MKESEAKTKWCLYAGIIKIINLQTMANLAIAQPTSKSIQDDIQFAQNEDSQKCAGSGCMMWSYGTNSCGLTR